MGVLSKMDRLITCKISSWLCFSINCFFAMTTSTYADTAIQTCVFTAFSDCPQNDSILRYCLIHLKNLWKALHKFFKESKQYLNLGKSQFTNFEAQIADTTLTMIQYI